MTLTLLAAILETAVDYGLLDANPAKGKRRRARDGRPRRSYLDTAEQIAALLDAAGELDSRAEIGHPGHRHIRRRAMLATLTFAGLRLGELLALRWRDVDLAAGRLRISDAKTEAGVRDVRLRPVLRDELLAVKAATRDAGPIGLCSQRAPDSRLVQATFAGACSRPRSSWRTGDCSRSAKRRFRPVLPRIRCGARSPACSTRWARRRRS